jgi:acyl-CoA dehydrogenase
MAFFQTPPALGNQFDDDRVLQSYLRRTLGQGLFAELRGELRDLGELAGGELYRMQLEDRLNEPVLTPWDAWGNRIDHIEVTPLWKKAARIACERGIVATAYERKHGALSRVHQMALLYLFNPSTDVYSCPLAMTDGAAKTLTSHQHAALIDRAVTRLTSRDPDRAWTSGQWMTERTGGSDVGLSETVARQSPEGLRLYGTKWFTSATTAQMALTLARPEGNPPGGSGLALFYVELRDERGRMQGLSVNRLKDKLGTRKVPTAELTLDGLLATPVAGLSHGVRNIAPMLNITRTWNAVCAVSFMRRGMALARDFARKRVAFGASLSEKPLHLETLADMQAEFEGALQLTFRAAELLGREEAGTLTADEGELLRLITPLCKLTTGKQAVAFASELLESFGGAGYIEDTGLPGLLRDAQVLPIWEGTTNVLSLDALRALARGGALAAFSSELRTLARAARSGELAWAGQAALDALAHAEAWLMKAMTDPQGVEAGARRFALTLGKSYALAALVRHAQWSIDEEKDGRAAASAVRLAKKGVDLILDAPSSLESARALANDTPLAP